MSGCEPHSENFGGTILLTRESGSWKKLWYKAGVETRQCHKVKQATGREILVCLGGYGGQGFVSTSLYVEDLTTPTPALMANTQPDGNLFEVEDNVATCGVYLGPDEPPKPFPLQRAYLQRVIFDAGPDGKLKRLSIYGREGTRPMTPKDAKDCINEHVAGAPHKGLDFTPQTKPFHVIFNFDGTRFKRVGKN
jgi:hypothetical protein